MNETNITPDVVAQHGLTEEEYKKIIDLMGREPNITELGVFSVMWSEHCSYKSSRVHLKRLPTSGPRVIVPPGENAGVVDIGDVALVAYMVVGKTPEDLLADFNGNGIIDIGDAAKIAYFMVGRIGGL